MSVSIPVYSLRHSSGTMRWRDLYDRFKTSFTPAARDVVNSHIIGPTKLIRRENAETGPGLCFATASDICPATPFPIRGSVPLAEHLEDRPETSLALSQMLYEAACGRRWEVGDNVEVRVCAGAECDSIRAKVPVTERLVQEHRADRESITQGRTRVIYEDVYGHHYKRGERNSRYVACRSALVSGGQVVCCRCVYEQLYNNVDNNEMDPTIQAAIRSVISRQSFYRDVSTIARTSLLYSILVGTIGLTVYAWVVSERDVAATVVVSGLSLWYTALYWVASEKDTGFKNALTFAGSEECVGSHLNMGMGNNGKPLFDEGRKNLSAGTYIVQDTKKQKVIMQFISAAMCTTKMREVLRPEQSCALGRNVGSKTLWDILMTSERIMKLGCLLTNRFYVVHTASGLKVFRVSSASATARHTNWSEITEEVAGVIESHHVVLGGVVRVDKDVQKRNITRRCAAAPAQLHM